MTEEITKKDPTVGSAKIAKTTKPVVNDAKVVETTNKPVTDDTKVVKITNKPITDDAKTVETTKTDKKSTKKASNKAKRRAVSAGQMHVKSTFNNTIVAFSDKKGNVLTMSSAGACGFRGGKKGTAYAAQVAAEKAAEAAKTGFGIGNVDVFVRGVGLGRDAAIRAVSTFGIVINSIRDNTPIPHGGVRPKGERKP
jgi:small subunit ribosomal protein S11